MTGRPRLQLRVLYTINSSPQYILARSQSPVPVTSVPQDDTSIRTNYATVSLKTCLDTICRSSPELIQDNNRDYSVYVLDPLESNSVPAPMNISNSNNSIKSKQAVEKIPEQPCGVAVGFGLMSWALHENDGAIVTGTRIKLNTGQEALEVIFALRETVAMQRASLSSTMRSWGLPLGMSLDSMPTHTPTPPSTVDPSVISLLNPPSAAPSNSVPASTSHLEHRSVDQSSRTLMAIQARNKAKSKPKKFPRPSTTLLTESDKLVYVSETYLGPLKKKGRPKNSTSSGKVSKNAALDGEADVGASHTLDISIQTNAQIMEKTLADAMPSTPLADASLTSAQPSIEGSLSNERQPSLLDLLTVLSSCGNFNAQNADLLATLDTIDSSNLGQPPPSEPNPALVTAIRQLLQSVYTSQPAQLTSDDSGTNHSSATKAIQDEDIVILDKENVDPMAFRRRTDKESCESNGYQATQLTTSTNTPTDLANSSSHILSQRSSGQENATVEATMRRKRTLSDFMDEKESERNKQRERKRSERRELRRYSGTLARRLSGSSSIYDTGLKHYPRLAGEALPGSRTNSYYRLPLEFRSSPPRPKSDASSIFHSLARPMRYSERKAPASSPPRPNVDVPPRKHYVVPEWARTSTATQPRLSEEAQRALAEAEERKKEEKETRKKALGYRRLKQEVKAESNAKRAHSRSKPDQAPVPLSVSNSCPVFAASVSGDIFSSSHFGDSTSPPRSPPGLSIPIPQTPPRKRAMTLFTSDDASGSLFTPTPKARSGCLPGSTEGSRFTPGKLPPPSPSPLARTNPTNLSPIQVIISGKNIGGINGWNGGPVEEDGWDGPDGPPSSLPTASDAEDDTSTPDVSEAELGLVTGTEGREEYTVRQHWPDLPPSSPPPPSSPSLAPQDQDEDVELTELPVPTSDIEESISPPPAEDQQSDEESIEIRKDDFDSFFTSLSSDGSMPLGIDPFSHLSSSAYEHKDNNSINLQMLDSSLDPVFHNGLVDFDFTEFWESFKPMVEDHVNDPSTSSGKTDSDMNLDHFKIAEDVQALFSGCLM